MNASMDTRNQVRLRNEELAASLALKNTQAKDWSYQEEGLKQHFRTTVKGAALKFTHDPIASLAEADTLEVCKFGQTTVIPVTFGSHLFHTLRRVTTDIAACRSQQNAAVQTAARTGSFVAEAHDVHSYRCGPNYQGYRFRSSVAAQDGSNVELTCDVSRDLKDQNGTFILEIESHSTFGPLQKVSCVVPAAVGAEWFERLKKAAVN